MLKPQVSPTRELIGLDGLWKFAIDTAVAGSPWSAPAAHDPRSGRPRELQRPVRRRRDPRPRRVGLVPAHGARPARLGRRADLPPPRRRDPRGRRLRGRHEGRPSTSAATRRSRPTSPTSSRPAREFRLTVGVNNELTNITIPPGVITVTDDGGRKQDYLHDFFNYAGLARSVWLYSAPAVRVTDVTVTTDVDGATGLVGFDVETTGADAVRVALRDADGQVVATASGEAGVLRVADVHLWQPGAAYLYDAHRRRRSSAARSWTSTRCPSACARSRCAARSSSSTATPFYFTGFGKPRRQRDPRQGPRQRLPRARLPADGLDRRELLPHVALSVRRRSHGVRRPPRHRRDRRDRAPSGSTSAMGGGIFGGQHQPTFSPETINDRTRERARPGDPRARRRATRTTRAS